MPPSGFTKLFLCLCVFVLLGAAAPVVNWSTLEKDKKAPTISPGTHTITVFADDVDRMVELDKTNNQLSQTITISGSGPLPDLIPTSLTYNTTTGLFTVVVLNQGTGPTPAGVVIGNAFFVDGTNVTWGAVPGPLAAGASVSINSSGGGAYTPSPPARIRSAYSLMMSTAWLNPIKTTTCFRKRLPSPHEN
jgi:subtilase family serine protease